MHKTRSRFPAIICVLAALSNRAQKWWRHFRTYGIHEARGPGRLETDWAETGSLLWWKTCLLETLLWPPGGADPQAYNRKSQGSESYLSLSAYMVSIDHPHISVGSNNGSSNHYTPSGFIHSMGPTQDTDYNSAVSDPCAGHHLFWPSGVADPQAYDRKHLKARAQRVVLICCYLLNMLLSDHPRIFIVSIPNNLYVYR